MLVNCKSCEKKFVVPDSAITESGRLLQCGSCGNKWTQYPIKEQLVENIKITTSTKIKNKPSGINKIKNSVRKKKRKIKLYSEEYLKNKHGLEIQNNKNGKKIKDKKNQTGFGFYGYLITISIFVIAIIGFINLTKEIIIIFLLLSFHEYKSLHLDEIF